MDHFFLHSLACSLKLCAYKLKKQILILLCTFYTISMYMYVYTRVDYIVHVYVYDWVSSLTLFVPGAGEDDDVSADAFAVFFCRILSSLRAR